MSERIVAVGLLTARDLEVLGSGFRRVFQLDPAAEFDDLLLAIDRATAHTGRQEDRPAPSMPGGTA